MFVFLYYSAIFSFYWELNGFLSFFFSYISCLIVSWEPFNIASCEVNMSKHFKEKEKNGDIPFYLPIRSLPSVSTVMAHI